MKNSLYPLVIIMLFFGLDAFAKDGNPRKVGDARLTAAEDSRAKQYVSVGDVFIVGNELTVYNDKSDLEKNGILAGGATDMQPGEKFRVLAITRLGKSIAACIALSDSSKAYILNLPAIKDHAFLEGQNSIKTQARFFLVKYFEFRSSPFWYFLLSTIAVSVLFLIFFKKINTLFAKWSQARMIETQSGIIFLIGSALFGAFTGISLLFYGKNFKEFILGLPQFGFPSDSGLLMQFYWSLQPFFLLFFGFVIYRYTLLYGPKFGIIGSGILLIPAFTIFWSSMMLSLVVVIAAIIVFIMMMMGSMASDTIMNSQPTTVIKDQMGSSGEMSKVEIKYNADGREKSRRTI
jgi:hypothetical protein